MRQTNVIIPGIPPSDLHERKRWQVFDKAMALSTSSKQMRYVWFNEFTGWQIGREEPSCPVFWKIHGYQVTLCDREED